MVVTLQWNWSSQFRGVDNVQGRSRSSYITRSPVHLTVRSLSIPKIPKGPTEGYVFLFSIPAGMIHCPYMLPFYNLTPHRRNLAGNLVFLSLFSRSVIIMRSSVLYNLLEEENSRFKVLFYIGGKKIASRYAIFGSSVYFFFDIEFIIAKRRYRSITPKKWFLRIVCTAL